MTKRFIVTIGFALIMMQLPAQRDLKLWYNKPADKWTEALPIGNGRLGAMIFGGVQEDRIQFNEETLWTGGPRNYNKADAHKYLAEIRRLIAEGKQAEAEKLAGEHFMGLQSDAGDMQKWVAEMKSLKGIKGNPAAVDYDDSKWQTIEVPSYEGFERVGLEIDGAVWFRTSFDLPANWKGKNLVLDLNRIRDFDMTYVNGKLVGTTDGTESRKYIVPHDVLVPGKNIIAIQVLNYYDKGGIAGYKDTSRHIGLYPKDESEKQKLSLNGQWKYFVQSDNPPDVSHYQASYQPFGDVVLRFSGQGEDASDRTKSIATNYKRDLDIANSVSTTTYTTDGVQYKREYFVSQPHQVLVIHLTASQPGSITFEGVLQSSHKKIDRSQIDGVTTGMAVQVSNGALHGQSYLRVFHTGGKVRVSKDRIIVLFADEVTLYLTAATNYKSYKDVSANAVALAKKPLATINGTSYEQIKKTHISEYQKYFNTLQINLGKSDNERLPTNERINQFNESSDPSLVALYLQYGRYLLISSSRPGTRPANLQGIWNDLLTPPWGSKYTTNINLEMNYWPADLLNLSPMNKPLFNMIDELQQTGRQTAKAYYDAPGWVLHHNTDLWRGTAPINASNHGIWVTGGAWLCHHLWDHYLFTKDTAFLRNKAYPAMRAAAQFFNSFLVKDPKTGWLINTPSNSPEHGGLVAGPSMDHQIIRDLFSNLINASQVLQVDKNFRDTLQTKLPMIAPDQIGRHGQLQEWLEDKDDPKDTHRHVSHLWAVYPGSEINYDSTPKLMQAAKQSLLYRGDAATGWSLAWKINLWTRLKDGDHAFKLIKMLLSPAEKNGEGSYPNLFDAHPPFQIDGNFGGAAGIGEMLIQSHTQYIDLLPALPTALPDGEVKGICARGGFVCNITWKDGKLHRFDIKSNAGEDCLLRYNGKTISFKTTKGKTYSLNGDLQML